MSALAKTGHPPLNLNFVANGNKTLTVADSNASLLNRDAAAGFDVLGRVIQHAGVVVGGAGQTCPYSGVNTTISNANSERACAGLAVVQLAVEFGDQRHRHESTRLEVQDRLGYRIDVAVVVVSY